jgi:hypothetical protein
MSKTLLITIVTGAASIFLGQWAYAKFVATTAAK